MLPTLHPNLPNWLEPKPLSPHSLSNTPSLRFEVGLTEWETLRGDERCSYAYYINEVFIHLNEVDRNFGNAKTALERIGFNFGWRLVPFARWAAKMINRPDIAHDIELAVRAWLESADAVWRILKTTPATDAKAIQQAIVKPLRDQAHQLAERIYAQLEPYAELGVR